MNSKEIAKAIYDLIYSISKGQIKQVINGWNFELVCSPFPIHEIAFSYRIKDGTNISDIESELSRLSINKTFMKKINDICTEPTHILIYLP